MGLTRSPLDWYTARAAGIVAYLLLSTVIVVGLSLAGQLRLNGWPRFAVTDVHRFGGLLVATFVSLHVATIAIDSYTPFTLTALLVPLESHYRPLWTAIGIVAAELLLALGLTTLLRSHIPYRWWRRLHVLNLLVWAGATIHGIGSGTDSSASWMIGIYVVAVAAVLAALGWRLLPRRDNPMLVGGLAGATCVVALAAVLGLGALTKATTKHATPPSSFADSFQGSLSQQNGPGGALVSVIGNGSGSRRVLVRVDLVTTDGSSVSDTALQLDDLKTGELCSGTVSTVTSSGLAGNCTFPNGSLRTVSLAWTISGARVNGNLTVGD